MLKLFSANILKLFKIKRYSKVISLNDSENCAISILPVSNCSFIITSGPLTFANNVDGMTRV